MKRELFSGFLVISLLISMLGLAFNIQPVKAEGTIYIRADGSVEPPSAPISTLDMVTYTFTGDIFNESIVVQRDNIVIHGAGHTLQGTQAGLGIDLPKRKNVTITEMTVRQFSIGVFLDDSSGNTMSGNNITNNSQYGILVDGAFGNTISGNNITNNYYGIELFMSSGNIVSGNNITANNYTGIELDSSSGNTISGNNITNNYYGIELFMSSGNIVSGNNITANNCTGMVLVGSSFGNTISGNIFVEDGLSAGHYGNMVVDNVVNGKPLVYLEGVSDVAVGDAGQVILISCNRIQVKNLNLHHTFIGVCLWNTNNTAISGNNITNNSRDGVMLGSSFGNTISGNNITNTLWGIELDSSFGNTISGNNIKTNHLGIILDDSSGNTMSGNNITNNSGDGVMLGSSFGNTISGNNMTNNVYGVFLAYNSSDNSFFHNNFMDNSRQVYFYGSSSANVWDDGYPSGGNYWSDYTEVDANSDGIGDTPYVIDVNNTDHYPLVNPWTPATLTTDFLVTASPTSLTIQQGSSDTSAITITSINGFNQLVQLAISGAPSGVTATLNTQQVTPPAGSSTSSTMTVSVGTTAAVGSYTLTVTGTNDAVVHTADVQLHVGSTPDQPPNCIVKLQKNNVEISQIDVGEFLDINVGGSIDDRGIAEVRFSSDGSQDNQPTGVWTQWYDWSFSSGDWNAQTKTKQWSFETPGYKEVWAEIKDDIGQTDAHLANIYVPGSQPPTCVVRLQKNGVEIADIDVGKSFDIYVGGSTDDAAIVQVCFSSDDSQDGYPSGVWTDWYGWSTSSGDWDTIGKTMRWSFSTPGRKEVWAMVKDSDGNAVWNHADVFVNSGYAIIVSGSGAWGRTFDHCANNVYRVLRNLGFNDDHIYYLNSVNQDVDGDGDSEVDGYASYTWFTWAINQVKDRIGNDPTPLIIYLVGHGSASAFTFDDGTGPDSFLFDSGGIPPQTKGLQEMLAEFPVRTPLFVMINSCYSGCFITSTQGSSGSISSANRIIITTAHDDQELGVAGWFFNERHAFTWVRSSDRFWANLNNGLNVKEAYVRRATAGDNWHLWLDDNGDKSGHPPNNLDDDGELAAITKIGIPGTESLELTPWQYIWKYSPGELRVYDSQNRVTGLVNGHVREEIPNSIYFEQYELVGIFSSSDTYCYEIVGTETGTYGLSIASVEGAGATVFTAIGIPETVNSIHQYTVDWAVLSQGGDGVIIQVDSNGDGVFEYNFTSDSELSRIEYVAATTQHDLGITGITSSKSVTGEGYTLPVNVTTMNYGVYTETFNVTFYVNTTFVASQTVTLAGGNSTIVTFAWNTTGFAKGNYTITAYAEPVPNETYIVDNNVTCIAPVHVGVPGDVSGTTPGVYDGVVNMKDVAYLVSLFNTKPSSPNWNPNADVNNDGVVNMKDIAIAVYYFNQHE